MKHGPSVTKFLLMLFMLSLDLGLEFVLDT